MQDGRSRITVVGPRRRLDVAVPSAAPIGEYVAGLARLCGTERGGVLPAAWSLSRAGAAPLPLGASLAEVGVTDGQVLYLGDLALDPDGDPVVEDVDEQVVGMALSSLRTSWPRGLVVTMGGLVWLVAAATVLWLGYGANSLAAAVTLTTAALLLLAVAWGFETRRSRVPSWVCLAISLTSVPCLGAAGALLAEALAGGSFRWVGVVAGCNAATLLTLVATPEAIVFALELQFAAAAVVAPILLVVKADAVQTAAAVAVTAFAAVVLSKSIAATIALFARRVRGDRAPVAQVTTDLLVRSRQLVPIVTGIPVVGLAVTLPILAGSGQLFAMLLAGTISAALLSKARQSVLTTEAVLVGGAGLVGAFALLFTLLRSMPGRWWVAAVVVVVGLILVAGGTAATQLRESDQPPPGPADAAGPPRRRTLDVLGLVCAVLSAPMALGALGVLGEIAARGRELVS
jgi:type VII secretion integral membrane protein EccD